MRLADRRPNGDIKKKMAIKYTDNCSNEPDPFFGA